MEGRKMRSFTVSFAAFVICAALITSTATAQQDTAKAKWGWKHSSVGTLTLTQVAFTDWSQGGDNALSWALGLDGKSILDEEHTNWSNSYKFGFGQARLGDQSIRKTDDRIDLESVIAYKMSEKLNPYGAATLKTQFAHGYKYAADGSKTAVSQFFDPAYLTQSAGVVYQPFAELKTRLGAGLREIITSDFPGYADDPSTRDIETTRIDGGLESVTELNLKLEENVTFSSKIELFAPFKRMDEIVVRNDNMLTAKVSKYLAVMLNVQLVNEKAISPRTQYKEVLAFGFSYTFL
jgi:hypothetical protein